FACLVGSGLLAWLLGWPLRSAPHDGSVPERFQQLRSRLTWIWAIALLLPVNLLAGVNTSSWVFLLASLVIAAAVMIGHFPTRKAVLEEQWNVAAYLAQMMRIGFSSVGFWYLLLWSPSLVSGAGEFRWWTGFA